MPAPTTAPKPSPSAKPRKGLSKNANPMAMPKAAPSRQQIHSGLFTVPPTQSIIQRVGVGLNLLHPARPPPTALGQVARGRQVGYSLRMPNVFPAEYRRSPKAPSIRARQLAERVPGVSTSRLRL